LLKNPRTLLHVITTIDIGGAENHLLNLSREQKKMGYDVKVGFLKGNAELLDAFHEAHVEIVDIRKHSLVSQVIQLRRISKTIDIVHAHLPRAEILTMFSMLFSRKAFFVSRHNAEPFWPNGNRIVSRLLSRLVLYKAKSVIAISETVKHFLYESNEVSRKMNLQVVYYSVDSVFEERIFQSQERPESYDGEHLHILCIARLVKQKDHQTLFLAIAHLLKSGRKVKLHLIGAGDLEFQLRAFSKELMIADNVIWHGRQSNVIPFLKYSDLFVISSLYEGFGLVLLEAIALGVPVVSSAIPTAKEILGHHDLGLFPVGDHMALAEILFKFLFNADERNTLRQGQASVLTRFSRSQMVAALELIYFS
jgi:glycosyltransferase involved in cell wall biosynthesis